MSLIRTAANKIASFVIRYASAGSKEWAQTIASELNCIESDWRALAWAFGGLRVLFSIQPSPLRSIADLDEEACESAAPRDEQRVARHECTVVCAYRLLFEPDSWNRHEPRHPW